MPTVPAPYPAPPLPPAQKSEKSTRRRRRWAGVPLVLSLLAVGVEAAFHPCASLLFDPLPDLVTGVAYAWVIFFPVVQPRRVSFRRRVRKERKRRNNPAAPEE